MSPYSWKFYQNGIIVYQIYQNEHISKILLELVNRVYEVLLQCL